MRRRQFVAMVAAAAALPFAASAEPSSWPKRVGLLMSTAEHETHEQAAVAAFVETLKKAGWVPGRNLEIALRWGDGDGDRMAANAREIINLAPDAIAVKGPTCPTWRSSPGRYRSFSSPSAMPPR